MLCTKPRELQTYLSCREIRFGFKGALSGGMIKAVQREERTLPVAWRVAWGGRTGDWETVVGSPGENNRDFN